METDRGNSRTQDYQSPFIHEMKLTRAQWIRGIILGSILFPLRVTLVVILLIFSWVFARLRLAGLSLQERSKPLRGWRHWFFHPVLWLLGRAVFFSLGFLWVKVKGRKADLKEAPVLVVAPHSSFMDMVIMFPAELPSVVSRSENKNLPVIGALLECSQSVMVSRKDPESRKKTVTQLNERVTSNGYWPQMLMFPEGTTTNGRCLLKFKPGAFVAGVPVQPVLLRYPNKLDTVRWTYKGTSWSQALWHTVSQPYTNITVEFLPVYHPSQEEKNDPNLYADNVQKLMARDLGVPATDFVMDGRHPVSKLGGLSLPLESPARETLALLRKNGLRTQKVKTALDRMLERCCSESEVTKVSAVELTSILGLTDRKIAACICGLYSKDETVDLRQIYLSIAALTGCVDLKSLLHSAFTMFDREGRGSLSQEELSGVMGALLGVPQYDTTDLYKTASVENRLTEENLLHVLTSHAIYQKVTKEYLQPEQASSQPSVTPLANGESVNNASMGRGNGFLYCNKKSD